MKFLKSMRMAIIYSFVLTLLVLLIFFFARNNAINRESSHMVELQMVRPLRDLYGKYAFLIEARGYCSSKKPDTIALKKVFWSNAVKNDSVLSPKTIASALAHNSFLTVRDNSENVIIIRWNGVSSHVLEKNIGNIKFSGTLDHSAPAYVINKLWYSDPIRNDLRSGVVSYLGDGGGLFSTSPETGNQLDGEMIDVSVEDVLVKVASTFGGVIFYAECPRSNGINFYVDYHSPKQWW